MEITENDSDSPSNGQPGELTYGIRFKPDLVVLNFFIGNDIQNKRGDGVVLPDVMLVAGQSYYVHSNGNWLHDAIGPERWYLYHDLNYLAQVGSARVRLAMEQQAAPADDRQPLDAPPLMSRRHYVRGIHERSDIYLVEDTPFFRQHLERTQQTLLAFQNFLAAQGIPLLVTVIPDHVQLDRTLQREYLAGVGVDAARYDFHKPQRLLMAWFRDQGIPAVDLWPAFEATGDPEPLYFRNDFHLTAQGHRLAADIIFPALRERLPDRGSPERRAQQ